MKNLKKSLILIAVFSLAVWIFMPSSVYADNDDFTIAVTTDPSRIASLGGEVIIKVTVENVGLTNITKVAMALYITPVYITDSQGTTWNGTIGPGSKQTISWAVKYPEGDLDSDINIQVVMNNDLDLAYDGSQLGTVRVASEDNVFKSNGQETPQKDVYYVGETVTVTDTMRNSLEIEATDLSIAYYFKRTGGTEDGAPIELGDVAGGATEEYSFDYTFTAEDIGNFRIGSEISYLVSDKGPYSEYNVAHDFVVEPPTDTPTPTPEPTPTVTPEPTPTPAASDTGTPADDTATAEDGNGENGDSEAEEATAKAASPSWLKIFIISLAVLLVAAIVVLIVLISKRNKGGDEFG